MINILSYVGMNLQSEVCLWTLLGLLRTIFDATLFKVNANLKQVWQMGMPAEISMPVQRVLRTMISGIMLVQCFTVYIYLATYIVLLYPAFLEERPTLVLPWLLLAAIRKLLCELLSLALGLGTCVLVGAARPPCVKFVLVKIVSIMPSVYMWMLVLNNTLVMAVIIGTVILYFVDSKLNACSLLSLFLAPAASYYNTLKVASVFQSYPTAVPANDLDYGLELAIRRRRTKSLQNEAQLRRRLLSHWYEERPQTQSPPALVTPVSTTDQPYISPSESNVDTETKTDAVNNTDSYRTSSITGSYEDWFGNEITVPRNTDRITEQLVLMLLRISAYLRKTKYGDIRIFESHQVLVSPTNVLNLETCPALTNQAEETPPLVGSSKENTASYLRLYPQIFMKGTPDYQSIRNFESIRAVRSSIIGKFSEPTEWQPLVSAVAKKNTKSPEEKSTNSARMPSAENIDIELDAENELNNITQQQKSRAESEISVVDKVIEIKSHDRIMPKRSISINSDNSLSALIAKMQFQLSEIISFKNTLIGEDSNQCHNSPLEASDDGDNNSNNKA